jgi:hypothetical protein
MATQAEHDDWDNRTTYHPPVTEQRVNDHGSVRNVINEAGHLLLDFIPPGRERSLVQTNLEQAMFWANAAIARQSE